MLKAVGVPVVATVPTTVSTAAFSSMLRVWLAIARVFSLRMVMVMGWVVVERVSLTSNIRS